MTRKKKQALDNLLGTGRISQATHDVFDKEIDDAVAEIEKQQKVLLEKMATKVVELEGQVRTMEMLLANFEIRHVTGEIDEETYQRQNDLLLIGLETARSELDEVKEAADQLAGGELPIDEEIPKQPEVKFIEEPPAKNEEPAEQHEQTVVQAVQCAEEPRPEEAQPKVEEKQQT